MLKGGVDSIAYGVRLPPDMCTGVCSTPESYKGVHVLCQTINLQTLCRAHYNATKVCSQYNTTKVC